MSDRPKLPSTGWSWCTADPCEIIASSMTPNIPKLHAHEASGLMLTTDWKLVPTRNTMWFPETETR